MAAGTLKNHIRQKFLPFEGQNKVENVPTFTVSSTTKYTYQIHDKQSKYVTKR